MPGASTQAPRRGQAGRRWATRLTWAYAGVVLAALAMIRLRGDVWWPATLMLFAPRWVFLLPMPTLALAACLWRRKLLWAQGATLLLIAWPLMHASIPFARTRGVIGPRFRIMTYNLGQSPIDSGGLAALIDRERIELICFQEQGLHLRDLELVLGERGWSRDLSGSIWSRLPIVAVWSDIKLFDGDPAFYRRYATRVRVRSAEGDEFVVANAHMPTMQPGFRNLLDRDLGGFRAHESWRATQLAAFRIELNRISDWPVLAAGDLNTPGDSPLLDPLRDRFDFAFERAGWGYGYTRPTSMPWTRIDHILADSRWAVTRCWVGPDLGSDHLPVIAEVVLRR